MSDAANYPVRVDATLDSHLNRWMWLVKWLLATPHYVVLLFLWVAFVVVRGCRLSRASRGGLPGAPLARIG